MILEELVEVTLLGVFADHTEGLLLEAHTKDAYEIGIVQAGQDPGVLLKVRPGGLVAVPPQALDRHHPSLSSLEILHPAQMNLSELSLAQLLDGNESVAVDFLQPNCHRIDGDGPRD